MSDILDTIDAAVGGKCACGCGQPLDPDGASMWFATQDCQWAYQQRHADNPDQVNNRPDYSIYSEEWNGSPEQFRRAYLDAPAHAHAPRVLTAERLRRAQDQLREHAASPRLVFTPTTRVWMNGQEITQYVENVTLEREEGEPIRVGFNGYPPTVRDDIRVEVQQGEATYVIDEQRPPPEVPLPRLGWGTLRSPLSRNISEISPDEYWPSDPVTTQQWIEANPIIAIDNAEIERMRQEAFANLRITPFDVAGFQEGMRTFADSYTQAVRAAWGPIRTAFEGLAEAARQAMGVMSELDSLKRQRMHYIRSEYRQRCLARRRRNH